MKIAIAQTFPTVGEIYTNIAGHKSMIQLAVNNAADCIIFPELSITGYATELASTFAMDFSDERLNDFQIISDKYQITIGIGIPLNTITGVTISTLFFRPGKERQIYSKQYLHPDEKPYFIEGKKASVFNLGTIKIALAICYEISISEHVINTFAQNPDIFVASVVKSKNGIKKAITTLSNIAKTYHTPVFMSNSIGVADGEEIAGLSSSWDENGNLIAQLGDKKEGILLFDTQSKKIEIKE